MRRLLSPSKYAELELITGKESKAVDEETVDKEYKKLTDKLSAAFDSGDRNLNRARMASVLSMLPVFFNSRKEVMDYVRNSLASCNNIHEKNVAISNILKQGF